MTDRQRLPAEMKCRWDRDAEAYLDADSEVCDTPKKDHCQARRTCSNHLAWGEQTCARCLGRVRQDVRMIGERSALLLTAALEHGRIDSEASNLAGPAADVEAWSWRKVAAMQGRAWHASLVEEDEDWHPFTILTRWAWNISHAYDLPKPDVWTISNAAAFLERNLSKFAQDEAQDFPKLRTEIHDCRKHLDTVLALEARKERGVPCPECAGVGKFARLQREYSHWCEDAKCARIHVADESLDLWVCPRDREHAWTPKAYRDYLQDRRGA